MSEELAALRFPDFIGVGPARTGTTGFTRSLKGHVGLPLIKETQFFKRYYDKGPEWSLPTLRICRPMYPSARYALPILALGRR